MNADENERYGTVTEPAAIRFERIVRGPVERVWAYLTESERRGRWLASGHMEPAVGGSVELVFRHANLTPHDETPPARYADLGDGARFTGRVTVWDPPHRLAYTWAESWGDESEVTFELTPRKDGRVLLVLVHRRIPEAHMTSVAAGWHTHLAILVHKLEGAEPPPFWSTHERLESVYGERVSQASS